MRLWNAEYAATTREPGSLPGNHDSAQLFDGESSEKRASLPHPVRGMGRLFCFLPDFFRTPCRRQHPPREREKESGMGKSKLKSREPGVESRRSKVKRSAAAIAPKRGGGRAPSPRWRIAVFGLLPILLTATAANAATVQGTVLDPDSRAVSGARVSLLAPLTALGERETDAQGRYEFAGLRGGVYKLVASVPGFSTASADVEVSEAEARTVDLRLRISAVEQHVVVSASLERTLAPEIGSSVSVVDQPEMEAQGAQSVLEVLRGVPGVEVNQTGRRGGVTGVFIRG